MWQKTTKGQRKSDKFTVRKKATFCQQKAGRKYRLNVQPYAVALGTTNCNYFHEKNINSVWRTNSTQQLVSLKFLLTSTKNKWCTVYQNNEFDKKQCNTVPSNATKHKRSTAIPAKLSQNVSKAAISITHCSHPHCTQTTYICPTQLLHAQ